MNLKPAEQWDALWVANRIDRLDCIRQIQADALRYAIAFVKERQLIRATLQELNHQANQLDPRPE